MDGICGEQNILKFYFYSYSYEMKQQLYNSTVMWKKSAEYDKEEDCAS